MKKLIAVAFALVALPASAAVQYSFVQKNTSPDPVAPSTDLTARAIVDGERSRVDFISGNTYPPGTYVVSTDGSRRLFFVDPTKKWYTEVNTGGVSTALSSSKIRIENLKSTSTKLEDRPVIAGIPTDHHRLTISYDITVAMNSVSLKQHVTTEIDSWTTDRFGKVHPTPLANGLETGNAELDRLLATELNFDGFPLRQLVTIRTTYDNPGRSKAVIGVGGAPLEVATSKTITRETWITDIREAEAKPSMFVVPVNYRRADQPDVPRSATETLTFDPAAQ